jgi:F-type H+-transporting ATPase subunit delta
MKNIRAARRYAVAFFGVAEERGVIDRVAADFDIIGQTLRGSRELRLLLSSPVVSRPRKQAVFHALFDARVGKETGQFLQLLIQKQREALLPELVEEFFALRDARANIVNCDVVTAVPMTTAQEALLRQTLERMTGKGVRIRPTADPSIRGGMVVKIGDRVLDASVRQQLESLRRRFLTDAVSMSKG